MLAIALTLAGSLAILFWLFQRGRTRNVLACVGAVLMFFSFGPLVNMILGAPVFRGTVQYEAGRAATGFLLALAGLAAADLVLRQRRSFDPDRTASTRTYDVLPLVLLGLSAYALAVLAAKWSLLLVAGNKLDRIELAGRYHYLYLLLELFAMSVYFIARRAPFTYATYLINAGSYLLYCMFTDERDFIFVGFALLIQWQLFNPGVRPTRLILAGVGGIGVAAALAASREGLDFGLTQALNQGSIPFVDTFVMSVVPEMQSYQHGRTYLDAVLGLLPGLRTSAPLPLNQWLVAVYSPGLSRGGYGFSLSAEAYLNFGLAGIPVVFFLLGLAVRYVVNRCDRSDWWTYLSVVSILAVFSALRGDSAQLVNTLAYATLFFAVLHILSDRGWVRSAVRGWAGPSGREWTASPGHGRSALSGRGWAGPSGRGWAGSPGHGRSAPSVRGWAGSPGREWTASPGHGRSAPSVRGWAGSPGLGRTGPVTAGRAEGRERR